MKKKFIHLSVSMLLLTAILMANLVTVQAVQIEPRYTGLTQLNSTLTISSSGNASCTGKTIVRGGYTADLTVTLKRSSGSGWTTVKTWTDSGSGTLNAGKTYYVTPGYDYCLTTTADVYNSSGKLVESPSKDSDIVSY